MNKIRFVIPNTLTVLNLLCGTAAIISLFEAQPEKPFLPVLLLLCAAIFDVFDGLSAKLLKATSEFGKQLDSLSDLVSFGIAPAIMIYKLLIMAFVYNSDTASFLIENASLSERMVLYSSLLIAVFAALRLARFNISEASSEFIGLPVPASALVVISVWVGFHITESELLREMILNIYILLSLVILLCYLMVSNITMLSLKFKGFSFKANLWRYVLIAGAFLIFFILRINALFFIMLYYILLSVIYRIKPQKRAL